MEKTQTALKSWEHEGCHLLEKIPLAFQEIEILILSAWACWLIAQDLRKGTFYLFSNNYLFLNSLGSIMKEVNFH
jgi:hypothetical protein